MDNTQLVFKMYEYFNKGDMASIKKESFTQISAGPCQAITRSLPVWKARMP